MSVHIHRLGPSYRPTQLGVLALHGFPGGATDMTPFATALDEQVLAPDLLGFGRSTRTHAPGEVALDRQADALASALRAAGHRELVVVGHDVGVPIGVLLADRHPDLVTGLVCASGNVLTDPPLAPPMRALDVPVIGPLVERALFSHAANRGMARFRTSGAATPRDNDRAELLAIRSIFATALRDLPGTFGPIETAAGRIAIPVEVVWGTRDPFFDLDVAARVAAALRAELHVVPEVGHHPHLEAPEALAAAARRVREHVTKAGASSARP